jgi:hypothetical protein
MVMVCFSAIIERKPPWAIGSRASRYQRQRANAGGFPLQLNSKAEWYAAPPNNGMKLTGQSVTPFAKGRARARYFGLQLIPGVRRP